MNERESTAPISKRERRILGAIGGAAAGAALFPAISGYGGLFFTYDPILIAGFLLRLVIFGCLGAFWAHIHDEIKKRKKVFELGFLAPSLIAGLLVANAPPAVAVAESIQDLVGIEIISAAHAQATPQPPATPPDKLTRLLKGLLGK